MKLSGAEFEGRLKGRLFFAERKQVPRESARGWFKPGS